MALRPQKVLLEWTIGSCESNTGICGGRGGLRRRFVRLVIFAALHSFRCQLFPVSSVVGRQLGMPVIHRLVPYLCCLYSLGTYLFILLGRVEGNVRPIKLL